MKLLPILFFVLSFSCSNEQRSIQPEVRNTRIPDDAFFVKGINTGYWCKVNIHYHGNNALLSVYSSADGKLLMVKRFFITCKMEGNPIWMEDLKEQIEYFDGEKFHLRRPKGKDSCWMQK